jgi:hypothetical protein
LRQKRAPDAEDSVAGLVGLGNARLSCGMQCRLEISDESISDVAPQPPGSVPRIKLFKVGEKGGVGEVVAGVRRHPP